MNKKLTKLLSVFVIAGVVGTGAAAITGCSQPKDPEPTHTHTAGTTWESDATNHWNLCTGNDGEKMNVAAHKDDNKDGKCDVCDYQVSTPDPQPENPTVTGVTVTAAGNATTVANGGSLTLSATVAGTNNPAQTVTWSIKAGATATEATVKDGVLSAGTVAGTVTVVATSTADTTKSGEITITVEAAPVVIEVAISGDTTVAAGATIQLTATTNDEAGVTWAIDDTTVATIDENGLVTGVGPGMAVVTATSKTDPDVSATYDIAVTQATRYDILANRADNRLAENFGSYEPNAALAEFTDWGTKGVYTKCDATDKVTVVGGVAKAQAATKNKNISLMADFGSVEGVVEGYFEYKFLAAPSGMGGNSVNFYNGETKVLSVIGNAVGTAYTIANIPGVAAQPTTNILSDTTSTVTVEFKFDLTAKKVTLKLNDTVVCEDLACDISQVSGFEVVTSNGGMRGIEVDNIAVCGAELTAATQAQRLADKLAELETTYNLTAKSYYEGIKTTFTTAAAAATTVAGVNTAYAQLVADMKAGEKTAVDGMWADYTHDADKVATVRTAIKTAIDTAADVADIQELLTESALAARLEAADIHEDAYYAAVDVTVDVYEKGTTTSVKMADANLTEKDGQSFTLDQLKDAITVPANKQIKAIYSDEACTQEITEAYTLNANGSTTPVTVIVYVEFEDVTVVNHTLVIEKGVAPAKNTTDTVVAGDFTYTSGAKTESNKIVDSGYDVQVSLTGGKVATNTAGIIGNAIMFTIEHEATVTVVAGAKADKPNVALSVLDAAGNDAVITDITKDGVAVDAFSALPTALPLVTYTFKLQAGTYYLGGNGGGAYLYALNVAETVPATPAA